jgi:DNA repair exonuclease SbcCD ATPase subunit
MHAPAFSALPCPGYSYGYSPQTAPGQFPPPAYYSEAQQLSSPQLFSNFQEPRNASPAEDTQDWSKLTRVLPELNRLLSKYEAQKGQTSAEGSFASQLDHHRTHEIASLRVELEANKSEYEKVIQKLIAESFALKRQIEDRDKDVHSMQAAVTDLRMRQEKHDVAEAERGELNTRQVRLQEEHDGLVVKHERTASELQEVKTSREHIRKQHEETYNELHYYRNESANWKSKYQEAIGASDQARLAKEDLVSAKMQLESQVDELRRKAQAREDNHQAEVKALRKDYEILLDTKDKERSNLSSDHKAAIGSVQLELAGLIDRHSRQKKDLESSKNHAYNLEKKLDLKTKEREEQSTRHRQQMEAKTKEIEDLAASHRRQLEAQLASLTAQREKDIESLKHDHDKAVHSLRKEHDTRSKRMREDHVAELRSKQADLDKQTSAYDAVLRDTEILRAKHEQLAAAMVLWKKRQEEWQAEQKRISEIMEGLSPSGKS